MWFKSASDKDLTLVLGFKSLTPPTLALKSYNQTNTKRYAVLGKMKITITKLFDNNIWAFSSKVGTGAGYWSGKTNPIIGTEYDIEINIDDKINKARSTFLSEKHEYFVDVDNNNV